MYSNTEDKMASALYKTLLKSQNLQQYNKLQLGLPCAAQETEWSDLVAATPRGLLLPAQLTNGSSLELALTVELGHISVPLM